MTPAGLRALAATCAVSAALAVGLAVAVSPWVLLAWPAAGLLFGVIVIVEDRAGAAAWDDEPTAVDR